MLSKNGKSFREERFEFRHKIVDAIYDKIPADMVKHLGNANKELIFAIEGVFNDIVKRIDDRITKTEERHSIIDRGENPDNDDTEEGKEKD